MTAGSTTTSADDVRVAVWDLDPGSTAPPMLMAHATGFHGRVWEPIAQEFAHAPAGTSIWHPFSLDLRGHGDTPPAHVPLVWSQFVADVLATVDHFGLDRPVGIGHSMGGASLLGAEVERPGTFAAIVVFEPVVFPPTRVLDGPNPLAVLTAKRRADFPSLTEARSNFASKPPMSLFRPDVLDAYVEHGLRPVDDDGKGVTLKCSPAVESNVYASDKTDVWSNLHTIECPVLVMGGSPASGHPLSQFVEPMADLLPNARAMLLDHMSHFGPLSHPTEFVDIVRSFLADVLG